MSQFSLSNIQSETKINSLKSEGQVNIQDSEDFAYFQKYRFNNQDIGKNQSRSAFQLNKINPYKKNKKKSFQVDDVLHNQGQNVNYGFGQSNDYESTNLNRNDTVKTMILKSNHKIGQMKNFCDNLKKKVMKTDFGFDHALKNQQQIKKSSLVKTTVFNEKDLQRIYQEDDEQDDIKQRDQKEDKDKKRELGRQQVCIIQKAQKKFLGRFSGQEFEYYIQWK
ncbi:hypothetical protein PPERSA_10944 [Pseudocohnilembus persalinus]|uniref:Uncharacterized protein n=1 Tax=Pseudocohnilembus persalinus TaxID=266149 RepID=A0A0V0QCD8_PSEPJ|nr:hypothetical protein PPERSA_10944 [Pseudocohnilembus persalinus]|eukprot:KRW99825.1 hypothetical protein PPERSA_10944 [Pseudocohnilembus persalinus]